jgi:hypothetical protein
MSIPGFGAESGLEREHTTEDRHQASAGEPANGLADDSGGAGDGAGDKDQRRPYRVDLPGFISEDVGLGDVVKRVTATVGIRPCGGCLRRAQALNSWLVFSPRAKR